MKRQSANRSAHVAPSIARAALARDCARRMLRPLLRVLIATGLSQQALIDVCTRSVERLSRRATATRIKALSRHEPLEHIVAHWANNAGYLESGKPMRLRIVGKRPSFETLVKSVAPSLSASVALGALRRRRVVKVTKTGDVELLSRFCPARSNGVVDIELVTKMAIDFLRTYELNLLENPRMGEGLFQRFAQKHNSDERLAPIFNRHVREQGQLFLENIDEWLVRHQPKRASTRRRKKVRLGVGIYVINEALR